MEWNGRTIVGRGRNGEFKVGVYRVVELGDNKVKVEIESRKKNLKSPIQLTGDRGDVALLLSAIKEMVETVMWEEERGEMCPVCRGVTIEETNEGMMKCEGCGFEAWPKEFRFVEEVEA